MRAKEEEWGVPLRAKPTEWCGVFVIHRIKIYVRFMWVLNKKNNKNLLSIILHCFSLGPGRTRTAELCTGMAVLCVFSGLLRWTAVLCVFTDLLKWTTVLCVHWPPRENGSAVCTSPLRWTSFLSVLQRSRSCGLWLPQEDTVGKFGPQDLKPGSTTLQATHPTPSESCSRDGSGNI